MFDGADPKRLEKSNFDTFGTPENSTGIAGGCGCWNYPKKFSSGGGGRGGGMNSVGDGRWENEGGGCDGWGGGTGGNDGGDGGSERLLLSSLESGLFFSLVNLFWRVMSKSFFTNIKLFK